MCSPSPIPGPSPSPIPRFSMLMLHKATFASLGIGSVGHQAKATVVHTYTHPMCLIIRYSRIILKLFSRAGTCNYNYYYCVMIVKQVVCRTVFVHFNRCQLAGVGTVQMSEQSSQRTMGSHSEPSFKHSVYCMVTTINGLLTCTNLSFLPSLHSCRGVAHMSTSIRLSYLSRQPSSTPWLSLSQGEEGKERRREREILSILLSSV